MGVAPAAHVVNLKAPPPAARWTCRNSSPRSNWAVEHRNDPELNIRVLNLSFGTDALQDPQLDPLSHAVEVAWKSGIVVVVSAGNDGGSTPLRMLRATPTSSRSAMRTTTAPITQWTDDWRAGTAARVMDMTDPLPHTGQPSVRSMLHVGRSQAASRERSAITLP